MRAIMEFILALVEGMVNTLLAVVWGGVMGWIVGLFFGDTILGICASLGIADVSCWQLGVFLAFIGIFFRVYRLPDNLTVSNITRRYKNTYHT